VGERDARGSERVSRTTYLSRELVDRARAAVYWTRVIAGEPNSFSELSERALRAEVERLENEYNRGRPFEIPEGEGLRPGPAPGVMPRVAADRRIRVDREQD